MNASSNHGLHGADCATAWIPGSLPVIVRTFKSATTKRINRQRGTPGSAGWQADYYEHIVRDDEDLRRIREYILDNPPKWAEDPENPANLRRPP